MWTQYKWISTFCASNRVIEVQVDEMLLAEWTQLGGRFSGGGVIRGQVGAILVAD